MARKQGSCCLSVCHQNLQDAKGCMQGSIPDMTALTATYLELQKLYRDKADEDLAALEGHVRSIEQAMQQSTKVPSSLIRNFAKNARNLRCLSILFNIFTLDHKVS